MAEREREKPAGWARERQSDRERRRGEKEAAWQRRERETESRDRVPIGLLVGREASGFNRENGTVIPLPCLCICFIYRFCPVSLSYPTNRTHSSDLEITTRHASMHAYHFPRLSRSFSNFPSKRKWLTRHIRSCPKVLHRRVPESSFEYFNIEG